MKYIATIIVLISLCSVIYGASEVGLWTFDTLGNPVIITLDTIYLSMGDSASGRDTAITTYKVRGYEYIVELPVTWDTASISYRAVADTPLVEFISMGSWSPPDTNSAWADTNLAVSSPSVIADTLDTRHGTGSWETATITPMIMQLSDDELTAILNGQSRKPIEIYRGDSKTIDISVVDATGSAVDITGASAIFTARERENDSSYIIQKSLTITDAANGEMQLALTPTETTINVKSYPADIQLTLSDGSVHTIWKSTLKIKWDVSR